MMRKKELAFLKECLRVEVIGNKDKKFSWARTIRHAWRQPKRRFLFWWRIASYLYGSNNKQLKKIGKKINRKLFFKYNTDIELGVSIAPGLYIGHYSGIVITRYATIGKNFNIRQNTTIGLKNNNTNKITIGDNVNVGANSCIISENIVIGDNVKIGAFTFVNKTIPSNSIYYTKKENICKEWEV
ncbi:MAG: DapH/DapD/GlmU-related protein [Enterobacterales bacterium endosymbiont of Blomia tropicalis]|uniref:serine acetyltransferase n=1 Tax=Mixta mediterraneensis TaxID=2758443 RepID=UPI0025A76C06|nr:DapH/DapD/GlmU-related protein [Mixta mediterraneensis]MDL4912588.1 DapH/DapD/GlmU-related protein [Mixta mediterraneensis]